LRAVGERLRWLSKTSKAGAVCGAAKTGQLPFIDQFRPAHKPGGFKLRMAQESTFQAFTGCRRKPAKSRVEPAPGCRGPGAAWADHDRRACCLNVADDGMVTLVRMMQCARRHERRRDRIGGLRDRKNSF
jgi:hypothetical protein